MSSVPLTQAVTSGDAGAVSAVLANGADVNERTGGGQTPIILATIFGHTHLIPLLLEHGADPQLRDNLGLNAVDWAQRRGATEAIDVLSGKAATIAPTRVETRTQPRPAAPSGPSRSQNADVDKPRSVSEAERSRRWIAGLKQRIAEQSHTELPDGPNIFRPQSESWPPLRLDSPPPQPEIPRDPTPQPEIPAQPEPQPEIPAPSPDPRPDIPSRPVEPEIPAPPPEPEVPSLPNQPEIPAPPPEPEVPSLPNQPEIPAPPPEPEVPSLPNQPEIPAPPPEPEVPSLPNQPEIPARSLEPQSQSQRPTAVAKNDPEPQRRPSTRKRCPQCNAIYNSDLVAYCAHHVVALVDADEHPIISEPPKSSPVMFWVIIVITLTGSIVVGSIITAYFYNSRAPQQTASTPNAPVAVQKGTPALDEFLEGKATSLPIAECPLNGQEAIPGTVTVDVVIDRSGQVKEAQASGGDWLLRGAASEAALKSTFAPEKLRGRETEGTITYTFEP